VTINCVQATRGRFPHMLFREQCTAHIDSCAVSSQPLNSCFYEILSYLIVCAGHQGPHPSRACQGSAYSIHHHLALVSRPLIHYVCYFVTYDCPCRSSGVVSLTCCAGSSASRAPPAVPSVSTCELLLLCYFVTSDCVCRPPGAASIACCSGSSAFPTFLAVPL
jgi:hypothetical protein